MRANMTDRQTMSPAVAAKYLLFRKSLPLQVELQELARTIGQTDGLVCLEVGSPNPLFSYRLRKLGGQWHTGILREADMPAFTELLGDNVYLVPDLRLSFKKKIFDVVLIADVLESVKEDEKFIEECHGVLKPDGRLVVNVTRPKPWSLLNPLRDLLGLTSEETGRFRPGYSESELFNVLKHGFDVANMRSYSRWFVEFVDLWVRSAIRRETARQMPGSEARIHRIIKMAGPCYWIGYQLDMFLFFTRGFRLVASAKRRAWRPRNAPVLVDGRSISEAVLTRAAE